MKPVEQPVCPHCHKQFTPDYRNRERQKFCSDPACKKASKAESQRRWFSRNPDYFKGVDNVQRVQEWRKTHPNPPRVGARKSALQDSCPAKPLEPGGIPSIPEETSPLQQASLNVLQDSCFNQSPVIT